MAYDLGYTAASYPAGNYDFSAVTAPIFVRLDSTSRVVPAVVNSKIEGVLVNCPPIGNVCTVAYAGVVKMPVGGVYAVNQYLTSNASGVAVAADASASNARGIMLDDSDSTSDMVPVRLIEQSIKTV